MQGTRVNGPVATQDNRPVAHPELWEPFKKYTLEELLEVHKRYYLKMRHNTLASFWNEWYGLEEFEDGFGGIDGRNKKHGSKWRKHLPATELSYRTRLHNGIVSIDNDNNKETKDVIEEWEPLFTVARNSIGNLVKALQQQNKLPKGKRCGKPKD
ncbi:hypothetical protein SEMRO_949_G223660.1 [Seminavis robusta]|uniref:Uncharacterized protein n=1 Tax=Seminavis robusta TaxID=568900 RepID=A0A9N8HKJ8_9STRA|nr:hypothetical protein SEMRO_949_G223660.1 [Seminavis robusta]|eukprot:Sro949_g223660.1 n/a (155) ;mRNA; f:20682-21146